MHKALPPPVAFTVDHAVTYSGLSRSRLYTLIQSGDLPSFRIGGRRMILREVLDSFFARMSGGAK